MSIPAKRRATYQDVIDAPASMVAELIDGQLHLHPRPAKRHGRAASVLGMDLGSAFERGRGGPGGWVLLFEPELHLGNDILVPDLAGWYRDRFPWGPEEEEAFFTTRPDWVCEVINKSTARYDRVEKLAIYGREQIPYAWLLDPVAEMLEVYARQAEHWARTAAFAGAVTVQAPPFEAVGLALGDLWLRPNG